MRGQWRQDRPGHFHTGFVLGGIRLSTTSVTSHDSGVNRLGRLEDWRSSQAHTFSVLGAGTPTGLYPELCHERCWTEPKAAQRRDSAGGGNTQTAGFPDMRREVGCLKLDVVVVLEFFPAACSHPATAPSENSPLPIRCPGTAQARMQPRGGRPHLAPLLPDTCFYWISKKVKCLLSGLLERMGAFGVSSPPAGAPGDRQRPGSAQPPESPSQVLSAGRTGLSGGGMWVLLGLTLRLPWRPGRATSAHISQASPTPPLS